MVKITDDERRARTLRRVAAYVTRARRIQAHSILGNYETFVNYVKGEVTFTGDPETGEGEVAFRLPDEEALESLAARVRPLALQGETAYLMGVLSDLGWMLRLLPSTDAVMLNSLAKFRAEWERAASRSGGAWRSYFYNASTGKQQEADSAALGWAYIYHDTVHADESAIAGIDEFDIQMRYEAAVPLVCRLAYVAVAFLNYLRWLQGTGRLGLPNELFTTDVHVPNLKPSRKIRLSLAEIGEEGGLTDASDLSRPLHEAWGPPSQLWTSSDDEGGAPENESDR